MKRALLGRTKGLPLIALLVATAWPGAALAEDPWGITNASTPATPTWGSGGGRSAASLVDATSIFRDSPVTRAREMLTRAKFLDEAATVDEKAATELATRLGTMRSSAKVARERAERATPEEREMLGARADDLETDVIVSEAEIAFKRRTASENRRVAHELRLHAVKLVREPPALYDPTASNACDPPFRFTADGRKVYRVECLK